MSSFPGARRIYLLECSLGHHWHNRYVLGLISIYSSNAKDKDIVQRKRIFLSLAYLQGSGAVLVLVSFQHVAVEE